MSYLRHFRNTIFSLRNNVPVLTKVSSRNVNIEGDNQSYVRTGLQELENDDPSIILISNYNESGFRLSNGMSLIGPCALFRKTFFHWSVKDASRINQHSLSLFYMLEPRIDILVLGIGDSGVNMDRNKILSFMKSKKINVEILPTHQAISTFNFLNTEGRYVAAGLIPPRKIRINVQRFDLDKDDDER